MSIGCELFGYGPTKVLFLHGWLSDRTVYSGITEYFDHRRFTIALMDFRGYGLSAGLSGDFTLDEIVSDTLKLADTLGWRNFHIVGHSMGGMVAQKVAIGAADRLNSMVATTPVPSSGFDLDPGTRSFFESSATSDESLREVFNILTGQRYSSGLLDLLAARARASTSTRPFLAYLDAWTRTDFSKDARDLTVPALIIAGKHDGAISERLLVNTYLDQMPKARLAVIEGAGHYPMIEAPFEYFSLLDGHFSRLGV